MNRAYLSDVSPWWPMERQEAVLAEAVPGWPDVAIYRDPLKVRQRRGHSPAALEERTQMLRPTSRRGKETIYVASLAVLAWEQGDFEGVMASVAARRVRLISVDDAMIFNGTTPVGDAVAAWKVARTKSRIEGAAVRGGAVSAAKRKAAAKAAAMTIKAEWELRTQDYPTLELLKRAGITLNTAKKYLGRRPIAQYNYRRRLARKEKAR